MTNVMVPFTLAAVLALEACSDTSAPPLLLPQVQGLVAAAPSEREIDLGWSVGPAPVTGFQIWRAMGGDGAGYVGLTTLPAKARVFVDGRLTAGTTVCYELRAYLIDGLRTTFSPFTRPACATTRGERTPPPISAVQLAASTSPLVLPRPLPVAAYDDRAPIPCRDARSTHRRRSAGAVPCAG
jgi:hypothetical protein